MYGGWGDVGLLINLRILQDFKNLKCTVFLFLPFCRKRILKNLSILNFRSKTMNWGCSYWYGGSEMSEPNQTLFPLESDNCWHLMFCILPFGPSSCPNLSSGCKGNRQSLLNANLLVGHPGGAETKKVFALALPWPGSLNPESVDGWSFKGNGRF